MLRSPTMVSSVARVYEQCATGAMTAHCSSAISGFGRFAHVVVEREVRPNRNVVPRHEPQPGKIQRHVVVIQPALVPRRIVRRRAESSARRLAPASRPQKFRAARPPP